MKIIQSMIIVFLLLGMSACAVTFTDDAGAEFQLDAAPENCAVLFSSFAEMYTLAGGEVKITVYESIDRGFAAPNAVLVDGGAGKQINAELLIAAKPDFVICSMDIAAQAQAAELLKRAGIPAAQFSVESFGDYLRVLNVMCKITGEFDAYTEYGEAQREEIVSVIEAAGNSASAGKSVLFVRAGSTQDSTKAKRSEDHFAAEMLRELGCENIADGALPGGALSMEAIIERDPEYIFFSLMGNEEAARSNVENMLKSAPWSSLSAVRNGKYAVLPRELFHFKPNQRWAEAYRYLFAILEGGEAE